MEHNPDAPWYRRLHWQVLIAMVLGALVGAQFGEPMADRVGWIGDLFMKLLRMIIVPLVLTSIISGVASVGGAVPSGACSARRWATTCSRASLRPSSDC